MMEVTKIWLTPTEIWVQTADGRQACERFADYAALRDATPAEREQYTLTPYGIHWSLRMSTSRIVLYRIV